MTRKCSPLVLALLFFFCSQANAVQAQTNLRIVQNQVALAFPQTVTFTAEILSEATITSVVLEYGVDQLTCGTVVGKALPEFTASSDVRVSWTWDMRQSSSLPPGAKLWWHWLVSDDQGAQLESPEQTTIWLDKLHHWQVLNGGNVNLHWYSGGASFGQELHDYAAQALVRLSRDIGVSPDRPIDLYIYANTGDLKDAVLYEPSWTGGQAYPEFNIVIIGISPSDLEWGKKTEAHEMTHVLVGHQTFSCLGFVPTWLNEGLAVYGEGGPDTLMLSTFQSALASNSLSSLRSLNGNFPEAYDQANLAYGESYSVVNFLIAQYGREKMTALLMDLRDGSTADQALQTVYGFDTDGLEDAWRHAIGAPQRSGSTERTPIPTPTIVPTIEPISNLPGTSFAASITPEGSPPAATAGAAEPDQTATRPAGNPLAVRPGWISIFIALAVCILVLLIAAGLIIFASLRYHRRNK